MINIKRPKFLGQYVNWVTKTHDGVQCSPRAHKTILHYLMVSMINSNLLEGLCIINTIS